MAFRGSLPISVAALVAVAIVCASAAYGAVRVDILSSAKDAAPGEIVTHVFAVSHDGATAETFTLTVGLPPGWSALGVPPEISVAPGEEGVVFVTLAVPTNAAAGTEILTLRATSTADPTDEASAGVATRVSAVNRVELTPPEGQSLAPGETASYSVVVADRGNAQDVVAVSAVSSRGYAVDGAIPSLELSPLESREIVITLVVPADAAPGRDVLTVRAASTLYAGVEDEIAIFTTILPPGPEAVAGSLYEILPSRIALGIERDETAGTFDSRALVTVSGVVLDGTFAASAAALHPFGSGPIDIASYSLSYRRDAALFVVGDVSRRLTDLQSISCEGGSTSVDAALVDVALIAGGEGDETKFGGLIAGGPEEAQAGIAYSDCRDDVSRSAAWTGFARAEPVDGWILRAEGGLGTDDGRRGTAAFVGTSLNTGSYFLSAAAFSVDTYFPGPRNDSAGVEASQRLRLDAFSLGLSLAHTWNNVVRDPLSATLVTDSLGVNMSAVPWDDGPTLQGTITFERVHQEDGTPRDDVDALLAYSVGDALGTFPYGFSGRIADRCDLLLGTRERTLTHTQEVGLSVDELTVLLQLSEEQVVDLTHDLVLRSAGSTALVVRPAGAPHEASIEFRSTGDRAELEASIALQLTDDFDLTLGGFATWDRGDPTAARFGWSLDVEAALGIPLPFLVTKGRIAGRVFIDRNVNGVFDEGEPPAVGAVVFVEEGQVSTDEEGRYRFPPLGPRTYSLAVRGLPRDASFQGPIDVQLAAGERVAVDVPLAPILTIRGVVFDDANQNGTQETQEAGLSGVRAAVLGSDGASLTTTTGARGEFVFSGIRPGTYVVSLAPDTLPGRFTFTTPESQIVDAVLETYIAFGGYVRPQRVIVTFQPPTADGSYTPLAPHVGEPVTFDASASFDFDGTLVGYAWDFNGDGRSDSGDVVTSYTFSAPGTYRVTLTVTDDADNSDTKTFEIEVTVQTPEPASTGAAPAAEGTQTAPAVDGAQASTAAGAVTTDAPPSTAGAPVVPDGQALTPAAPAANGTSATKRPPVPDFAYSPVLPTAGQPVAFDAAASVDFDGEIEVYAWDFDGDGNVDAEGVTAEWAFPAAGSYAVSLTVVDTVGMRGTVHYAVDVASAESAPSIFPAALRVRLAYEPRVARAGETIRFDATASVSPSGQSLSFAWDFNADGAIDTTDPKPEWASDAPGSHPVTLMVTAPDGATASLTLAVPVIEARSASTSIQLPIASIQFAPASPRVGDPVLWSATASVDLDGSIVGYAWDFDGDGFTDSTEPIVVHAFTATGTAVVELTVFDDAGHSDTVTTQVVVQ